MNNPAVKKDVFGGDTYRRREVAPGIYQCGCRWIRYEKSTEIIEGVWIFGDVLTECPFHRSITDND